MVLVGSLIDLWNWLEIERITGSLGSRVLPMLVGLVLNAYGSALIIMSGIGIRVVDLVALTLVERLGWRFSIRPSSCSKQAFWRSDGCWAGQWALLPSPSFWS
jgi:uncharacterized membrane protein YczE